MAVANSDFSKYFYEIKFNNKLYSGRCRFMTQYVELFPIPNPSNDLSQKIIQLSKKAYQYARAEKNEKIQGIEKEINDKVWKSFGLNQAYL